MQLSLVALMISTFSNLFSLIDANALSSTCGSIEITFLAILASFDVVSPK